MTVPVRGIEESGFFTDASLNVADPSPTKVQIFTFFIIWKSEPEVRSWVAGDGGRHGVPRNITAFCCLCCVHLSVGKIRTVKPKSLYRS